LTAQKYSLEEWLVIVQGWIDSLGGLATAFVMTKEVTHKGTFWRNERGEYHREDGPAIERVSGSKHWYLNGQLHRKDGPACEWADGDKEWYLNGKLHREDGPAIEYSNGAKEWYLNGQRHREDGPACEWTDGCKEWYLNGSKLSEEEFKLKMNIKEYPKKEVISGGTFWRNEQGDFHREDGPAVELANGNKFWFLNGKYHRVDGPAVELADGTKEWYLNGQLHRVDGPAIERADGCKSWYLNGSRLNEKDFNMLKSSTPLFVPNKEDNMVNFSFKLKDEDAANVIEIIRDKITEWKYLNQIKREFTDAEKEWFKGAATRLETILEVIMKGTSR
jgi:antitoxin component YwqK of YwqJK toxin-antitoxin module